MIRPGQPSDTAGICEIYNHFVSNSIATFEEEPVTQIDMADRIRQVTKQLPWLVWEEDGQIAGYAYATPWRTRSAYRYSAESTVYVSPDSVGKGLGSRLYQALLAELAAHDIHCVLAGISLPNVASVAMHERHGFEKVGHVREVGRKFDRWIDVGYWQLMLTES